MQEVNVQVAVRIRPLSAKERLNGDQVCVRIIPGSRQLVLGKDRAFTFDNVLSSKTNQEEVYNRCVQSLVMGCFEGYNATVFAYGQTGSGKTFTIGGGNIATQTDEEFGIVPRAIKHMFSVMKDNPSRRYTFKVTYIEVYKEDLHDLLDMDTNSKDIHIREDESGNTVIIGASEVECASVEDVMSCLERGSSYRHTGTTQMNEYSSRSHSVFTIFIEQKWMDDKSEDSALNNSDSDLNHYMCAKFHFVDLAGSERAHRTGNIGDRFKESVHINTGLLALGNVISALGDPKKKGSHIPYRESKITRLLKDSLGGNSNTWMICCVSPASSNFDESLNALKYANRARNIKNKPIVNRDPHSIRFEEMQSEIKALREELQRQRSSVMTRLNAHSSVTLSDSHRTGGGDTIPAASARALEDKLIRIQTECSHYRMIADEAYKHLTDIQNRDILTTSLNSRLGDWLQLMEEIKNKVPNTLSRDSWENQTIIKLQTELKQVRSDLTNDEEIFAEKVKEVNHLEERIAELESLNSELTHQLEESYDRQKQQDDQLVSQQVLIEELELKLKNVDEEFLEDDEQELNVVTPKGGALSSRRAKSVPLHRLVERSKEKQNQRNIHTSPALFSLERVMAGFRARSQLLVSRIEDTEDTVQQQCFSDEDDDIDLENAADAGVVRPTTSSGAKVPRASNVVKRFDRNAKSRGTYRVAKSRVAAPTSGGGGEDGIKLAGVTTGETTDDLDGTMTSQTDDEKLSNLQLSTNMTRTAADRHKPVAKESTLDVMKLRSSAEVKRKKLKQSELDVRQSTQKMKDLEINIRMKEQLIRELVKSSRDSQMLNKQNENKIKALEKEKLSAKQELINLQKAYMEMEAKEAQDKYNKEKLQGEFRRKMELAKTRIHALQKKQKDTERLSTLTGGNEKRISDLEIAIERLKQQHDLTKTRLKDEVDRKAKIQKDLQRGQQQIRDLEMRNEQQRKVLKIKTEEMAAVQRKYRSSHLHASEEQTRLEEQKRWLDSEMEKVLEQRRQMETIEKELSKREDIVLKKEAMLAEKSELEMKKLRSSQVLSRDMLRVSTKLESVERRIEEKTAELAVTPREQQAAIKDEVKTMHKGRDLLRQQRHKLDDKLRDGAILSAQEERRLIELDEAVEALDAAIEYKNDHIASQERELRQSIVLARSDDNLLSKLKSLSAVETRILLSKYFEKVIDLRESERKKELEITELQMKLEENEGVVRELESSLEHASMERDRAITQQQQQYEHKIQALVQQLASHEGSGSTRGGVVSPGEKEIKMQQLEKDLFYYKKTSRELKKKLKEIITNQLSTLDLEQTAKLEEEDGPITARENRSTSARQHTPKSPTASKVAAGDAGMDSKEELLTSVRMSRKELRKLSDGELSARQSTGTGGGAADGTTATPPLSDGRGASVTAASTADPNLTDSLEGSRNPWT